MLSFTLGLVIITLTNAQPSISNRTTSIRHGDRISDTRELFENLRDEFESFRIAISNIGISNALDEPSTDSSISSATVWPGPGNISPIV